MLTLRELLTALYGVFRLMRGDVGGFQWFDGGAVAFWRSFYAALVLLPVWVILMFVLPDSADEITARAVVAQLIGYAIGWPAYALLVLRVAESLGRFNRYYSYMTAYNWFQLIQAVIWLPASLLVATGLVPGGLVVVLWFAGYALLLGYSWFLARYGLGLGASGATLLVISDFMLGMVIGGIAQTLARTPI